RVVIDGVINGRELHAPLTPAPMLEAARAEFPDVEAGTRLFDLAGGPSGGVLVRRGPERQFIEEAFYFVDSTFFDVFGLRFVAGDPATALAAPHTLVLTEEAAARYFPEGDAVGRVLTVQDTTEYRVTGVVEGFPRNAHFRFDLLGAMAGLEEAQNDFWIANQFRLYLRLREGADPAAMRAKFDDLLRTRASQQFLEFSGYDYDQFKAAGNRMDYELQPVPDIHLRSDLEFEMGPNGSMATVWAFSSIAAFILLLAGVNYVNLATARSAQRAKEVGVRKTLGSGRGALVRQFLAESVLLCAGALVVAVVLVLVALPAFNALTGKALGVADLLRPGFLLALPVLAVGVGLLAGAYPALVLSHFEPARVLKGRFVAGGSGRWLRSGLVVFQFAISIALIVSTAVVYRQLQYMQQKELGFDEEHVVVIERAQELGGQAEAFKDALRQHPQVVAVGASSNVPGGLYGSTPIKPEGTAGEAAILAAPTWVDAAFAEALGIEMAAGRFFSEESPSDTAALVLNEAAVRKLGWSEVGEVVGERVGFMGDAEPQEVIGVVEDFHFASLHHEVGPLVAGLLKRPLPHLVVRVRPEGLPATLADIEARWQAFAPGQPFEYAFLDEHFGEQYAADRRLGQVFQTFAVLAVLIACLGLFGLASYTTQLRTKEIGVRKTLGASVPSIVVLLSKDFLKLVAVAFAVAAPLAYVVMRAWLADFAYRVEPGALVFV
ncbi:MAG: ABC transporter permease, partial [Rhodothermales bacterium]|nr:ABC transporter permease [Rhodothermales bacterium]